MEKKAQKNKNAEKSAKQISVKIPVYEQERKKLTEKERKRLRKIKIDPVKIKALFDKGYSIWQVTELYYNFPFEHSDKRTWLFYQKINNERKRQKLGRNVIHLEPLVTQHIKNYLKTHTPDQLIELLAKSQ